MTAAGRGDSLRIMNSAEALLTAELELLDGSIVTRSEVVNRTGYGDGEATDYIVENGIWPDMNIVRAAKFA